MTGVRDFEQLDRTEPTACAIGEADLARYNRYCEPAAPFAKGCALDIGSGIGAFLGRRQPSNASFGYERVVKLTRRKHPRIPVFYWTNTRQRA